MDKLYLEKTEELEIKLLTFVRPQGKEENSRKNIDYYFDYAKAFDCVDHSNCGKF